jgi:fumarate hydratase class I
MILTDNFVELIRKTSCDLPEDVVSAIEGGLLSEKKGSIAYNTLQMILKNIEIAREKSLPMCQDTGTPVFYINLPYRRPPLYPLLCKEGKEGRYSGISQDDIRNKINKAIKISVRNLYLRPNVVDTLTEKNLGDGTGAGYPVIHFEEWKKDYIRAILMLKGGGCENVGAQYSLPDSRLNADRDLEGGRRCILDAVHKAQGRGCSPGIIGVCIGGDRVSSYEESKRQLIRSLDDKNENPVLYRLEREAMRDANKLGIGPMGFGGRTTLLGVKIGSLCRIPASYFVSVTYMCWAYRRRGFEYKAGKVKKWLY